MTQNGVRTARVLWHQTHSGDEWTRIRIWSTIHCLTQWAPFYEQFVWRGLCYVPWEIKICAEISLVQLLIILHLFIFFEFFFFFCVFRSLENSTFQIPSSKLEFSCSNNLFYGANRVEAQTPSNFCSNQIYPSNFRTLIPMLIMNTMLC